MKFIIVYILFLHPFVAGEKMENQMTDITSQLMNCERGKIFLKEIDYKKAADAVKNKNKGVLINWSDDSPAWKVLKNTEWEELPNRTISSISFTERSWISKRSGEHIALGVFVSPGGNIEPIDYISQKCLMSSMVEVPYKKGPKIGQWSIMNNAQTAVYWTYYNVAIWLERQSGDIIDLLDIATDIQKIMESNLITSVSSYAPKIKNIKISKKNIYKNDVFEIEVAHEKNSPNLQVKLTNKHQVKELGIQDQKDNVFRFKALMNGVFTPTFSVWDCNTLLSSKSSIEIIVK